MSRVSKAPSPNVDKIFFALAILLLKYSLLNFLDGRQEYLLKKKDGVLHSSREVLLIINRSKCCVRGLNPAFYLISYLKFTVTAMSCEPGSMAGAGAGIAETSPPFPYASIVR